MSPRGKVPYKTEVVGRKTMATGGKLHCWIPKMALVWNLPFPLFLIYGHKLCFTVFSATVAIQQSPPSPKQQLASLANMNFGTWEIEKKVDDITSCCFRVINRSILLPAF